MIQGLWSAMRNFECQHRFSCLLGGESFEPAKEVKWLSFVWWVVMMGSQQVQSKVSSLPVNNLSVNNEGGKLLFIIITRNRVIGVDYMKEYIHTTKTMDLLAS